MARLANRNPGTRPGSVSMLAWVQPAVAPESSGSVVARHPVLVNAVVRIGRHDGQNRLNRRLRSPAGSQSQQHDREHDGQRDGEGQLGNGQIGAGGGQTPAGSQPLADQPIVFGTARLGAVGPEVDIAPVRVTTAWPEGLWRR